MSEQQDLSVGGYLFFTEKDAKLASAERKKIEYLEARIDYSRPESILSVYQNAIQERIFKTPVGFQYLKGLRDFLLEQPDITAQDLPDIPLYCTFSGDVREKGQPARNRIKPAKDKAEKNKSGFILSVLLNVLLVLAIAAMFMITLRSDNPNVLNYERALTDKYASWEQELTERERAVREKELELQMENE